jgi:DNA-binding response OmpR family regulator
VLLVEDDASLRRSLCEFLHDHGFTTYSAGSNREAWQIIKSLRPSLCLLDLNLPDGSGLDLLRKLALQRLPVRVIVMTALPLKHLRPQYPPGTLAAWLTKPVPPQQLLETIEGVKCGP